MYLINEIWLITRDGLTIFNQRVGTSVNEDVFGGFISAIDNFSKHIGELGCSHIEMDSSRLFINACDETNIFFVCRSRLDVNRKKVEQYIAEVKKCFLEKYGNKLKDWNGDTSIFEDVNKIIDIKADQHNFLGVKLDKTKSKAILDRL
ncbi:MAG: hypothetical protein ACTSVY_15965 [Candidatus Helarchaeota archaeon]